MKPEAKNLDLVLEALQIFYNDINGLIDGDWVPDYDNLRSLRDRAWNAAYHGLGVMLEEPEGDEGDFEEDDMEAA